MSCFLKKFALFVLLLTALQVLIGITNKDDPLFHFPEMESFAAQLRQKPDIVYFGDSVANMSPPSDLDHRSIAQALADFLPERQVASFVHAGYSSAVFEAALTFLLRQPHRPKLLIVPVNLRAFSAQSMKRPDDQFVRERLLLQYANRGWNFLFRPLLIFDALTLSPYSAKEYADSPVFDGETFLGTVEHFEALRFSAWTPENQQHMLRYFYLYPWNAQNRRVLALDRLLARAQREELPVLLYLTAIDFESAEQYAPMHFADTLRSRSKLIRRMAESRNAQYLDLSRSQPKSSFCWQEEAQPYINEHLNAQGRITVAQQLAERTQEMLRKAARATRDSQLTE